MTVFADRRPPYRASRRAFLASIPAGLAAFQAAARGSARRAVERKVLPPLEGAYHCGFPDFGGYEDCVTTAALKEFAALAGKPPVWATFSNNWFDEIRFPEEKAAIIRDFGSIPPIRMMPSARDVADDVP